MRNYIFVGMCRAKDAKYAHLTEDEMKKVEQTVVQSYKWLEEARSQLASTPKHLQPPITIAQIRQESTNFENIVTPIINKPVPKPESPPKETKEAEKEVGDNPEQNQQQTNQNQEQPQQNCTQEEKMEWSST